MKRFLCIFSAFMLLVGCVKNDPVTPDWQGPEAEIAFECPIVGAKTKSVTEIKAGTFPADVAFRVWGYYSEGETPTVDTENQAMKITYINGAEFACEGAVWGATGEKNYYWPKNGYLHFLGYAPSGATVGAAAVTDKGLQLTGYTAPGDEDFLVSQVSYAQTYPGAGAGAPIVFEHALSSIVFKVKSGIYGDRTTADPDRIDTDLRVTKIELIGLHDTGDFDQAMTSWNGEQMTSPSAAQNPEKGWTGQSGSADFTGYDSAVAGTDGVVLTGDLQLFHDIAVSDEEHELTNLILLPQDLSSNADAVLRVTYDMTHSNFAGINGAEEFWVEDQVAEIPLKDCGVAEWLRGYRYTYNITVSLNKIQCSTDVDDWYDTVYYQEYDSSKENLTNETLNWQN